MSIALKDIFPQCVIGSITKRIQDNNRDYLYHDIQIPDTVADFLKNKTDSMVELLDRDPSAYDLVADLVFKIIDPFGLATKQEPNPQLLPPSLSYLSPIAAFDVDETLIDDDENPREKVVDFFKLLQFFGCQMVIWSNGGGPNEKNTDYAARIAKKLGLKALILEKGSIQADIVVDDLDMFTRISEGILGKVNIKV